MQYVIDPTSRGFVSHVWWDNEFTNNELDYLQQSARSADCKGVIRDGNTKVNEDIRRVDVKWLSYNDKEHWLFSKLSNVISKINAQHYGFNISGFVEPIQLTNYKSDNKGTYSWHVDIGGVKIRKLSLIMQLSDPSEYEGGELQLSVGGKIQNIPKKRGYITVIPSFLLHQVTPVTSGSRQSLVSWISGPDFV